MLAPHSRRFKRMSLDWLTDTNAHLSTLLREKPREKSEFERFSVQAEPPKALRQSQPGILLPFGPILQESPY